MFYFLRHAAMYDDSRPSDQTWDVGLAGSQAVFGIIQKKTLTQNRKTDTMYIQTLYVVWFKICVILFCSFLFLVARVCVKGEKHVASLCQYYLFVQILGSAKKKIFIYYCWHFAEVPVNYLINKSIDHSMDYKKQFGLYYTLYYGLQSRLQSRLQSELELRLQSGLQTELQSEL